MLNIIAHNLAVGGNVTQFLEMFKLNASLRNEWMNCNLKPIQNYFGYVNFRMSKIFYFEITKQETFTRAQRKLKGLLCGSAHTFEPLNAIIIFGAIESWSLLKRKNVSDQVMRCDTMRWSSWRRCCCVVSEVLSSQWKWSRSWNFPHMN